MTRVGDEWNVETVLVLGVDARLRQVITYFDGDHYYRKRWELTNLSGASFNDVRFIHGGDTYFGGSDSARAWWSDEQNMVYLSNDNFTNSGIIGFYGAQRTPADHYFGGDYSTGYSQASQIGRLDDTVNASFVDAGFQLEWDRATLLGGDTWVIEAYEILTDPTNVQVLAPPEQLAQADSTVALGYVLHNLSLVEHTFDLTAISDLGWTTAIQGSTQIVVPGLAQVSVTVQVTVPAGTPADTITRVELIAQDISSSGWGSGATSIQVILPDYSIDPTSLDFGTVSISGNDVQIITISNSGSAMIIGTIGTPDDLAAPFSFSADNCSGQTLLAGEGCTVEVTFAPSAEISTSDQFNIPVFAPEVVSHLVSVQGIGIPACSHMECVTCFPADYCTECSGGLFASAGDCVAVCPAATWGDSATGACLDCESDCLACTDENTCTGCSAGFYLNASDCSACEANCDACSDGTSCTACASGWVLFSDDCLAECPVGYFDNAGVCDSCAANCESCTDASTCLTCTSAYFLDGADCIACETNCDACTDVTTCTSCTSGWALYNADCLAACPSGFFDDSGVCSACEANCLVCTDASTCVDCNVGHFLDGADCSTCEANCDACSDASSCTDCEPDWVLFLDDCLAGCPAGFFDEAGICTACEANCLTCTDATTCTDCASSFFLDAGDCSTCGANCNTCSDATTCTACDAGWILFNSDCVDQCPAGFFEDAGICTACEDNCQACTDAETCTACGEGYTLEDDLCVPNEVIDNASGSGCDCSTPASSAPSGLLSLFALLGWILLRRSSRKDS
ncbi:MAG: choice-of-anchor D domain-containing protein [Deltaproteobacteria bacterium]|nr:choice-of-anchor D domain-containing protein [Deltaproteobacteria bacterium]